MGGSLEAALKELRAEEAATEKRLATIRRAKKALETLSPSPNGQGATSKRQARKAAQRRVKPHNTLGPRGVEAAGTILKEQNRPMTVKEVLAEVQKRGWIREGARAPLEATRVALRRLEDRGGARKLADGRWLIVSEEREAP